MTELHGIVIDRSLKSTAILEKLSVLSKKESDGWVFYKILVAEDKVNETVALIQQSMCDGAWYAHLYDGAKVIAIFKHRVFEMVNNPVFFAPAVKYGASLGIPREELDFKPNRFEDEDF
jgi:hypothetical protein